MGLDVRELDASPDLPRRYRLRVGDRRAVFAKQGKDVIVARVLHRRDGDGWLERLDVPLAAGDDEDA